MVVKEVVAVDLEDGYGFAETDEGWFVCDMFGLINPVGLPTKHDAEVYLRHWILQAQQNGRLS